MAVVNLSNTAQQYVAELGPADQETVDRAITVLEDDVFRSENRIDLNRVEQGYSMYACIIGRFWFGFVSISPTQVAVLYLSKRSAFRP